MERPRLAVTRMDGQISDLTDSVNHRDLTTWAADCAERVLPIFEEKAPEDERPRRAIEAARAWVRTGVFKMAVVRSASLSAHAAARDFEDDDAARSAARAAGQAVASAHVPRHAIAAGVYAATAVKYAVAPSEAEYAIMKERNWQYKRLLKLAGRRGKK